MIPLAKMILALKYAEMNDFVGSLIDQADGGVDWTNRADLADLVYWWARNVVEGGE